MDKMKKFEKDYELLEDMDDTYHQIDKKLNVIIYFTVISVCFSVISFLFIITK